MGLTKILIYSAFAGFSLSYAQQLGGDQTGVGSSSMILNLLPGFSDTQIQGWVMLASIGLAIFSIYSTGRFVAHIYENRLVGIVISLCGFLGSIFLFFSNEDSPYFVFLGFAIWIIGIIIIISQRD
jgi:4-hydroxybenzoate polyprenyltransferase